MTGDMSTEIEFLFVIAQVAIALIAFTTIVVVLRQMAGGCLSKFEILVVQLFTVCGFATLFLSLLPPIMLFFDVPPATLWPIVNLIMIVTVVGIHIWYFRSRKIVAPTRKWNFTNFLNLTTLVTAVVLLSLGTFGLAFDNSIAPYAFALFGLLLAAASAFLGTLTSFLGISPEN